MKLLVNGRFLTRQLTGIDRFGRELLRAIDRLYSIQDPAVGDIKVRVVVPTDSAIDENFFSIPIVSIGRASGQLWEQFVLPKLVQPDEMLLSLCNTAPAFFTRQIVAIHDAATISVPQAFSRRFRAWYRLLMPCLGKSASAVLTVSEFSRGEIREHFSIPNQKISVISEGGEHITRISPDVGTLKRFCLHRRPYIFAVSSMAAHKNFGIVLDAISKLGDLSFDIAIAGGANSKVFGNGGIVQSDRIKWLGYVTDEELRALYQNALAFVFPSLYEGFGIPPLEAMHCGCPVIAAHAASIPEVCGSAALYFDPRSADELAALLMTISSNRSLREDLKMQGYRRANEFSWETGARKVLEVCRSSITNKQ